MLHLSTCQGFPSLPAVSPWLGGALKTSSSPPSRCLYKEKEELCSFRDVFFFVEFDKESMGNAAAPLWTLTKHAAPFREPL